MKVKCPICGKELEVSVGPIITCPSCGVPLKVVLLDDGTPLLEIAMEADVEGWSEVEKDILEFEEEELEELWGDIEES